MASRATGPQSLVPRVRPDLRQASGYVSGATVPNTTKLSSNESGFDPLPQVLTAVLEAMGAPHRYPDNGTARLRGALGERYGVGMDEVATGAGSSQLAQELVAATCLPGQEAVFGWRSFEAYPLFARAAHATATPVPNRTDGRLDLPAIADRINADPGRVGIVFLCSPNNPTGAVLGPDELDEFLDAVPPDLVVVVDEAYREFADAEAADAVALYRGGRRNVVSLRTFSKAYGLAGLRVGYAIGAPEVIAALQAVHAPFSVTAPAQAAAVAALEAVAAVQQRVDLVRGERARVEAALTAMGLPVVPSQANFVWLPLAERTGAFAELCARQGVLVRPFHPDGVRITVSVPQDNDRFLQAAAAWAEQQQTP